MFRQVVQISARVIAGRGTAPFSPRAVLDSPTRRLGAISLSQAAPFSSSAGRSEAGLPATEPSAPSDVAPPTVTKYSEDALLLGKLARFIMRQGKLTTAQGHIAACMKSIEQNTGAPPLPILRKALEIAAPMVRVVNIKKGFKAQPTPVALNEKQQLREGFMSILEASRSQKRGSVGEKLAAEILAVVGGQSEVIKKKERRHADAVRVRAAVFMR